MSHEAGWKTRAELEHQIIRLVRRDFSQRQIARALGVTRGLVKRVAQGGNRAAADPHTALPVSATAAAATPRASKLDARPTRKLGCETCEGELVRAPMGDKVVSGGRLGSTLRGLLLRATAVVRVSVRPSAVRGGSLGA